MLIRMIYDEYYFRLFSDIKTKDLMSQTGLITNSKWTTHKILLIVYVKGNSKIKVVPKKKKYYQSTLKKLDSIFKSQLTLILGTQLS